MNFLSLNSPLPLVVMQGDFSRAHDEDDDDTTDTL